MAGPQAAVSPRDPASVSPSRPTPKSPLQSVPNSRQRMTAAAVPRSRSGFPLWPGSPRRLCRTGSHPVRWRQAKPQPHHSFPTEALAYRLIQSSPQSGRRDAPAGPPHASASPGDGSWDGDRSAVGLRRHWRRTDSRTPYNGAGEAPLRRWEPTPARRPRCRSPSRDRYFHMLENYQTWSKP